MKITSAPPATDIPGGNIPERKNIKNVSDIEDIYLKSFKQTSLFNISIDATPGPKYRHSPEERKRISTRQKGEKHHMWGSKHTPEAIAKISAASAGKNNPRYGVKLSSEIKKRISTSRSKSFFDIYDSDSKFIKRFGLWGDAAEFLGIRNKTTFYKYAGSGDLIPPLSKYRIKKEPKNDS
jgi:group I intron endonuclease